MTFLGKFKKKEKLFISYKSLQKRQDAAPFVPCFLKKILSCKWSRKNIYFVT